MTNFCGNIVNAPWECAQHGEGACHYRNTPSQCTEQTERGALGSFGSILLERPNAYMYAIAHVEDNAAPTSKVSRFHLWDYTPREFSGVFHQADEYSLEGESIKTPKLTSSVSFGNSDESVAVSAFAAQSDATTSTSIVGGDKPLREFDFQPGDLSIPVAHQIFQPSLSFEFFEWQETVLDATT